MFKTVKKENCQERGEFIMLSIVHCLRHNSYNDILRAGCFRVFRWHISKYMFFIILRLVAMVGLEPVTSWILRYLSIGSRTSER
jgi:hypothetical protein